MKLKCPVCQSINDIDKWNESTRLSYGAEGMIKIEDILSNRRGSAFFVCPTCSHDGDLTKRNIENMISYVRIRSEEREEAIRLLSRFTNREIQIIKQYLLNQDAIRYRGRSGVSYPRPDYLVVDDFEESPEERSRMYKIINEMLSNPPSLVPVIDTSKKVIW